MQRVLISGSKILDKIMMNKALEVVSAKARVPLADMQAKAERRSPCRGFLNALQAAVAAGRPAVIAEIKQASPSKGVIRADFKPRKIAESYHAYGATCLSVLTDWEYFRGTPRNFVAVRETSSLPMLRKDFLVDEYQVYESRAMGADCVLLIAAVMQDSLMKDLADCAQGLGMDVLVEVHDADELERALKLELPMIGINNRDLRNFDTELSTTTDLLPSIPPGVLVVTESGIHTREDVDQMQQAGVNCFLVGEAFMRADEPGEKLAELFLQQTL